MPSPGRNFTAPYIISGRKLRWKERLGTRWLLAKTLPICPALARENQ